MSDNTLTGETRLTTRLKDSDEMRNVVIDWAGTPLELVKTMAGRNIIVRAKASALKNKARAFPETGTITLLAKNFSRPNDADPVTKLAQAAGKLTPENRAALRALLDDEEATAATADNEG